MKNILLTDIIALLIIIPFWDFSFSLVNYLSFLPFLLMIIISLIFKVTPPKNTENAFVNLKLSDIIKASTINFLIFIFSLLSMVCTHFSFLFSC